MAIILVIPLFLMIFYLSLLIQGARHQTIDRFREMDQPGRILLPLLPRNRIRRTLHDLSGQCLGGGKDLGDT